MKFFRHVPDPPAFEDLPVITEETGRRYQTPAGLWYPSITTVLTLVGKKGIDAWRNRVGHEYADKVKIRASQRGNRFHDFAERYLNNENPDITELNFLERDVFSRATSALDRIDDIVIQEAPLYSDHLETAGRVDCIGNYEGKLSVIDFKTAEKEKDDDHVQHYYMQAAGYAVMYEERTGIPISNLVLIVATDIGFVQVLKSKRDKHIRDFIHYRQEYKKIHGA